MHINWKGTQCILCLQKGRLSKEHVIPKSLGGKLTCRFLCRSCNSRLGSELEAFVKSDRDIFQLAMQFQDSNSKLKELVDTHPHIGQSARGPVEGLIKNDNFQIHSKTLDGSLILPPGQTPQAIRTMLQREGSSPIEIEKALEKLSHLREDEDEEVEIVPGTVVRNWSIQDIKPDIGKTGTMIPLVPAIIAFEFLALHVGDAICGHEDGLSELREVFLNREEHSNALTVERLHAQVDETTPFHGIVLEQKVPFARVQIRFLAKLAFRVHFPRLRADVPRFQYTHELESGKESISDLDTGQDYPLSCS